MKAPATLARPTKLLRLLLVEDTDDDALLVERTVSQAGFDVTLVRVQTAAEFVAALQQPPDLVISDHSLPTFSSGDALRCLRQAGLDVPFIVVSGTIDEESAVALLRGGAHDFVTKQNLARLGPAIRRELQEARNRSEYRRAQEQLQEQRDFLRLVIDSNPAIIFVKDEEGRYTLANRAAADLYGTSPDALIGRTDSDFNRQTEEIDRLRRAERAVVRGGKPLLMARESITETRTGRLRWFESHRLPLVGPTGARQVLGIGIDITERVATEEALRVSEDQFRQAQKMEAVGQLAGGIAHDFNNLLTAILGFSDLLMDRLREYPDAVQDLQEIRRAGERAGSLTRQLLAFSRKQVLAPQTLDLTTVVGEAENILRRVIGEDIQLETTCEPGLRRVKADPGQIEQILMNLAINARDAMPTGGQLSITVKNVPTPRELLATTPTAGDECVALSVTDNGSGIPPDVVTRIFEPFFSTKSPGKGTGLGLSMVFGVVAQSGGHITVDSEVGRGTCFVIYLPATHDEETHAAATTLACTKLRGAERILVVEDDAAIRELVRKVLSAYGYHVLEPADVTDALAIAQDHRDPIHLLLSDVVMPHMSGPELARQIAPHRPDMRVLFMSGFSNRLATDIGALDPHALVLHKPFTPRELATKVRECLDRQDEPPAAFAG